MGTGSPSTPEGEPGCPLSAEGCKAPQLEKGVVFNNKLLPYLLLVPQLIITSVFFYWPASQAVWQSFLREDAFGLNSEFVGLENYQSLFADPGYYKSMLVTVIF